MSAHPTLSVCVCTHNRANDAATCLGALAAQWTSDDAEVLLIDSGSAADQAAALRRLASELADQAPAHRAPRLLREDQPGLSRARNTAIAASRGSWIAFLDDDAEPYPDYLEALRAETAQAAPDVGVIAGRLVAAYPSPPPAAIGPLWRSCLSVHEEDARDDADWPVYGANVVYRRAALPEDAPFREDLGRAGQQLLSGEETDLNRRLAANGWTIQGAPRLVARHHIAPDRLDWDWIRDRAYWGGVSHVLETDAARLQLLPLSRSLIGAPIHAARFLATRNSDFYIRAWAAVGATAARLGLIR